MPKLEIEGLKLYEQLHRLPKDIASRRKSKYDQIMADANRRPTKLSFENDDSATNVYVALRARIKRDKENLEVKKRGLEVYVFVPKISSGMRLAKIRTGTPRKR
ncbi:MAG TPA: hypothetical protein VJZ75_10355 [Candidatus Bathyarchaeia archaeon]|nr:hypothetical protein [Candidatus Bathyarchaeia archaeon]